MADTHYYCRACRDTGEVRHPQWGTRNCPEPTTPCPHCGGGEHAPED